MLAFTQLITFGSTAQQIVPANCVPICNSALTNCTELFVEQLQSNTHNAYVLLASESLANAVSGIGVVSTLAIPATTEATNGVSLPSYRLHIANRVDVSKFWFHGTSDEAVKVTFYSEI